MFSHIKELFTRPSGYSIAKSVRLRSSATGYFSRTPSSTGNRRTYTHSFWAKRGTLGATIWAFSARESTTSGNYFYDGIFYSDNTFSVQLRDGSSNEVGNIRTTQVFRDPSAWYHFVVVVDTTQATSSNRMKLYVNGSQVTALGTATYPSQNFDTGANTSGYPFYIGNYVTTSPSSTYNYDGYLTEINFIDGQALTPSSFGETDSITGVWKAKKYSGTYGTNGFYLNFSDNSSNTATTIGKDYSGNGNNWTPNNISVTSGVTYDSMVDSPTVSAVSSNYAVINPLRNLYSSTIVDGNLKFTTYGPTTGYTPATIGVYSGKWYWEVTYIGNAGNTDVSAGIANATAQNSDLSFSSTGIWSYYSGNGQKYNSGSGSAYGASWTTAGDVIGIALDADAGTLTFYKNNTSQGTAYTGLASSTYFPVLGCFGGDTSYNTTVAINFGQRPFTYTPPTGFVALNTWNLPNSTIKNGAGYMAATLYTGNLTGQSISNTNNGSSFQPDLVWIKSRSAATDHKLTDSVRGVTKALISDSTGAETTDLTGVTAINSDGFTVGASTVYNNTSATYVGWQWKAGGTSSSNTNGSITSTVSAGATQGFSVVTYTGTGANATVGHGLGVAPSMIITKPRNSVDNWISWHTSLGSLGYIYLNTTGAAGSGAAVWNSTLPTSTVFSLGTSSNANSNGQTQVAYCFAAVAGYSAFGSFSGNGSADGPFVFTGFRPRWIMWKNSSTGGTDWTIVDSSRNTYNVANSGLQPNGSYAEASNSNYQIDFLSNGFKIRTTNAEVNQSGISIIYACFAEVPFKFANAR